MAYKYNRLPTNLFKVRVPIISTYSEAEMNAYGLVVEETNKGKLALVDEEYTTVMLPLTRIIDIYSTGAPIKLLDRAQVDTIYTALEKYLVDTGPMVPDFNAPLHKDDRDLDIDRFASEMFDLNRHAIVNKHFNNRSGFDLGIEKMAIARPRVVKHRTGMGITNSFHQENNLNNGVGTSLKPEEYLTHNNSVVNPEDVTRKSRVRRIQKRQKRG